MAPSLPDIFEFVDYRAFLHRYYEAAKATQGQFSWRYFGRRAGFSSPNFLKLVADGKRNLSSDSVDRVADALRLDAKEQHFFANLVAFNQADRVADKNKYYERISTSRRFRKARQLEGAMFDYLSHWYYPAIREMAARPDFRTEPSWIAHQLLPRIRTQDAARAMEVLFRLGLLEHDDDGRVVRGEPTVTSGHEVQKLAVANYHRAMLAKAAESIERVESQRRDLSAMTVCISANNVSELKKRLQQFREDLMDFCDRDDSPEVVYQINVQLFPLSLEAGESL